MSEAEELAALCGDLLDPAARLWMWLDRHPRLATDVGGRARALLAALLVSHDLAVLRRLSGEWCAEED